MKYILVDTLNMFFRGKHVIPASADLHDKLGMSMHMLLMSANKVAKHESIDHVVFALEGGDNWRKGFYEPYKKPRAEQRQKRSEAEIEEDELFFEVFNHFTTHLKDNTNCSVIAAKTAEADDVIARFIALHPNDEITIVSTDTDYYQLVNERVQIYNGIQKEYITLNGTFDDDNKRIIDKKTKEFKVIDDPKWLLFEKCIRGDKSDNVFSAYPGVRKKGTKNKVGLLEAFADMDKKGYNWNNLMLQRWVDHHEQEHRVLDDYERNRTLIDLTCQPDEVKDAVDEAIINELLTGGLKIKAPRDVNFQFMKFCGEHDLAKISQISDSFVDWMSKGYKGHILELSEVDAWKTYKKLEQNQ